MNEKKPGGLWKKIALLFLGFILIVLLITTVFGEKGLLSIARARKAQAVLLREIEALKMEKARLEREIEALKKDPESVDKEARDKLWLIKPDEKVIVKKPGK
ncbi:MAG TPA: septum formation initiator family protein [Candidatus Aminicenantes bacterium]|nr:septum formation initiator family protein [Candidatus Aminicenantes bacterium]